MCGGLLICVMLPNFPFVNRDDDTADVYIFLQWVLVVF